MSFEGQIFYPADEAKPAQLVLLASEYRRAAETLLLNGRKGEPLSFWPFRLIAIHAIELYLNAFLLENGHAAESLRRMQHNLAARAELAIDGKLGLRKLTEEHLRMLTKTKEYWAARYWPKPLAKASELNRINATLDDVAKKVAAAVSRSKQ